MAKLEINAGDKYGRLTILDEVDKSGNSARMVVALCECGKLWVGRINSLSNGDTKSCGCYRIGSQIIDLTGNVYGRLTVLRLSEKQPKQTKWLCECECGELKDVSARHLKSGATRSCGCYKAENSNIVKYLSSTDRTGKNAPAYKGGKVSIKCKNCDTIVERFPSDIGARVFCSNKCWGEATSGEASPVWNPKLKDEDRNRSRGSTADMKWSLAIKNRDNFICRKCNLPDKTIMSHHILSYSKYPEARTDLDNGVTPCSDCHKEFHRDYGYKHFTDDDYWEWLKDE